MKENFARYFAGSFTFDGCTFGKGSRAFRRVCSPSTIADRVRSRAKENRSFGYGGFGVVDTTKNLRERERERERMRVRKEFLSCLVKKKKK